MLILLLKVIIEWQWIAIVTVNVIINRRKPQLVLIEHSLCHNHNKNILYSLKKTKNTQHQYSKRLLTINK